MASESQTSEFRAVLVDGGQIYRKEERQNSLVENFTSHLWMKQSTLPTRIT